MDRTKTIIQLKTDIEHSTKKYGVWFLHYGLTARLGFNSIFLGDDLIRFELKDYEKNNI